MEEIINKLIEIDNNAKLIVQEEKEKKNNFEDYIEKEFNTKKTIIDLQLKDEIKRQKQKMDNMLEEKKQQIKNEVQGEITRIEKDYNEIEQNLILKILDKIKNWEE